MSEDVVNDPLFIKLVRLGEPVHDCTVEDSHLREQLAYNRACMYTVSILLVPRSGYAR